MALPPLAVARRPDVLVSLYAEPAFVAGWWAARERGVRTAFWCQKTFDAWVPRRAWKDALKREMFTRVDATLGGGEDSRAFAMQYGVPAERALLLRHVIDTRHYAEGRLRALARREEARGALGLRGVTFLYTGRLWSGKGTAKLLDAFARLQAEHDAEVSLLLAGDGPDQHVIEARCARDGIRNVVTTGFVQKPSMPALYALGDVFVFPTLGDPYGLVVDEAMACSLPVISTTAAGEILDRVKPGETGLIVPPADAPALAEAMKLLARDAALRARMGAAGRLRIGDRGPGDWAADFERCVDRILSMRMRRADQRSPRLAEAPHLTQSIERRAA